MNYGTRVEEEKAWAEYLFKDGFHDSIERTVATPMYVEYIANSD